MLHLSLCVAHVVIVSVHDNRLADRAPTMAPTALPTQPPTGPSSRYIWRIGILGRPFLRGKVSEPSPPGRLIVMVVMMVMCFYSLCAWVGLSRLAGLRRVRHQNDFFLGWHGTLIMIRIILLQKLDTGGGWGGGRRGRLSGGVIGITILASRAR